MITRLVAAAVVCLALGAGCNHRKPGTCSVTCADDSLCPDGTGCGSDGFCHAAGEHTVCSSLPEPPDAGRLVDGGAHLDDAAPGPPDAEPPPPDADPCAGVPNRVADFDSRNFLIPDGDLEGIDVTLSFDTDCVTVETVQVWVEIVHTYRGDVEIRLTSPGGLTRLLQDSSDDSNDNIFAEFNLAAFAGESAQGDWVLHLTDILTPDAGTLQYWSIGINRAAP